MAATLKIDGYDFFPFLRVAPGEGFDPASPGFADPQFGEVSLDEAPPLISVNERNKELAWPVHLNPANWNRLSNGSFESGTTGWQAYQNGGTGTLDTLAADWAHSGDTVARLTATSSITDLGVVNTSATRIDVEPGDWVTTEGWTLANSTARQAYSIIAWYDSSSVLISSHTGSQSANNSSDWTKTVAARFQAPANAAYAAVYVAFNSVANGEIHYVDDIVAYRSGNKDQLHKLLVDTNRRLANAVQVEWRDDGATKSTFFDVLFARFDPDYNYRRAQVNYLSGVLRIWVKPYGHTGTYRLVGSRAGNASFGFPMFLGASGIQGDVPARVKIEMSTATLAAGSPRSSHGSLHGFSVMATWAHGFIPAASLYAAAGVPVPFLATLRGATHAIGSQSISWATDGTTAELEMGGLFTSPQTASSILVPPGRHHIIAVVRTIGTNAIANAGTIAFVAENYAGEQLGPTQCLQASMHWTPLDVGIYTSVATNSAQWHGFNISAGKTTVSGASWGWECCGVFILPENNTLVSDPDHDYLNVFRAIGSTGRVEIELSGLSSGVCMEPDNGWIGNVPRIDPSSATQKLMAFAIHRNSDVVRTYGGVSWHAQERFTYAR